ncbi:MAG: hypothetical protein JW819_01685 [Candidatus Krumholzibacteriota bacterium]|nr:hypothetical protein [Candidatus Krumholzibacteriota bacterium]
MARHALPAALAALLALAAAPPSRASEDAGTRSVFATPAGNRALALGGPGAALAGDASIVFRNPGGLGLLPRAEFQAAYASLYGLGFGEQHAALVLPSWRWGVAALGFRHFGVGGIDERDDRNLLLGEELGYGESEFTLGYGRSLGDAWSLGGGVKLRHQSLAGYSATGLGLDLGVLLHPALALGAEAAWARHWQLGLSVVNAVEPRLRLDQESVGDPLSLRLGSGYLHVLGRGRWALAVADLEKTRDMDLRLHAGLEVAVLPLALRVGINDGILAAGAGLRVRDLRFDYAWEDNAIEAVHRFGLTLQFGGSADQRRQAALRAEDERLQARLAAAFEERQSARLGELLAQAEAARLAGRFDEALELCATVGTLAPNHAGTRNLALRCLREKAARLEAAGDLAGAAIAFGRALELAPDDAAARTGLERCRAESNRRAARSSELRRQFAAALDAFGAGELAAAREGFRRILVLEPDDGEAAGMLARTEEAMAQRAASLLRQADRFIGAGLLDEAAQLVSEARTLDPEAAGLARLDARLAEARRGHWSATPRPAAAPTAGASTARRSLSRHEQEEVADLYRRGVAAAERGQADDALRYWELVWSRQPGYQQVDEYLRREYLMRGMEAFAAGRLEEAAAFWEKALRVDPRDERAIGYLARAREQMERTQEIMSK